MNHVHTTKSEIMTIHQADPLVRQVGALIQQRTGLDVSTQFRTDLEEILHDLAAGDLAGLVADLRANSDSSAPWQALMQALTINETYFFRDRVPFQILQNSILPNLIAQRRQQGQLELSLWSAGCATGEEAYSIAITLLELIPDLTRWTIRLKASDISDRVLQIARESVYREWSFRHTDAVFQARYFDPAPGGWRLKPDITRMVSLTQDNLMHSGAAAEFDIIFCRNVLLYFARESSSRLEDQLFNALTPGGWLVLGQSETIHTHRERWITHIYPNAVFYQKRSEAQHGPATRTHFLNIPPPEDAPDLSYQAAVKALHADQRDEAARLIGQILGESPAHAAAHVLSAYLLAGRQNIAQAHMHLDAALHHNPMLADAHYLRANLFLEESKDIEAIAALRAALYCERDHLLTMLTLGGLYARDGDTARAVRLWERARHLAAGLPAGEPVSALSDLNASGFSALIQSQIQSLQRF